MDVHEILAIPLALIILAGFTIAFTDKNSPLVIGAIANGFTGSLKAAAKPAG